MISKSSAEHYRWGGASDGWHLVKRPDISIIHERMPPGASEVKHYHTRAWQFFVVLQGSLTIRFDDAVHQLDAREGIEVEPGIAHQVRNDSEAEVEFIVTSVPPSHGDRVEQSPG